MQNGSLRQPLYPNGALDDINSRIAANRTEQNAYLTMLLVQTSSKPDKRAGRQGGAGMGGLGGARGGDEDEEVASRLEEYKKERMAAKMDMKAEEERRKKEEEARRKADDKRLRQEKLRAAGDHYGGDQHQADDEEQAGGRGGADGGSGAKSSSSAAWSSSFAEWASRYCSCLLPLIEWINFWYKKALVAQQLALAAIPAMTVTVPKDDGLSPLSADQYVKIRLLPMAASYSKKAPGLATSLHVSAILGVVLSVASSALSTFDLSVYIPAALAVSGAVTAWTSYQQIDLRLLQTNAALNQLNQLLVWWGELVAPPPLSLSLSLSAYLFVRLSLPPLPHSPALKMQTH